MRPWNDPNKLFGQPNQFDAVTVDDLEGFNYESPIKAIETKMQFEFEGELMRAVKSLGFDVDKDELLRALQYDREQYAKGYAAGVAADKAKLIESCYKDLVRMVQNSRTDNPYTGTMAEVAWSMAHDCILSCVQSCFGAEVNNG